VLLMKVPGERTISEKGVLIVLLRILGTRGGFLDDRSGSLEG
jgi:hypothetical protein